MNKPILFTLSLLIFIIFQPLLNGIFSYLFVLFDISTNRFLLSDMSIFIYYSYTLLTIPATLTGLVYAVLYLRYKKIQTLWLLPCLGCLIFIAYLIILCVLFTFFSSEAILKISAIIFIINILVSFICTLIANTILMK